MKSPSLPLAAGAAVGLISVLAILLVPAGPPAPSRPTLATIAPRPAPVLPDAVRPDQVPVQPPPTENWLGEDAESRNKTARKAWMEALHRAPPDVDWRAIERTNGLEQIRRRNALAGGAPPPADATGAWVERGSNNQAGRMHTATLSTDGTELYGGSSRGGLWRRSVDGGTWENLGDNLYGGAHHLVLFAADDGGADTMLAATDGGLVHRSDDDGATWVVPADLAWHGRTTRLIRSPADPDTAWMITAGWNNGWVYELLRSRDRGQSFQRIRDLDRYQGDVWTARTGEDTTLWLVDDNTLLRSSDLGDTFEPVSSLPGEGWTEAQLVGSEAGAPRLWTVLRRGDTRRLMRSDDAGQTWTDTAAVTDYWSTLAASITDPDLFAWGGVEVHRTFDGGESFDIVNKWGEYYQDPANKLHADNPGVDVVLDGDDEVWFLSTDGGLYESRDGLRSVHNLSLDGLRISQYYDTLTSAADPSHVAAGAQDQGYQTTQRMEPQDTPTWNFDQILSGDYGHLTSSNGTHDVVFSVYPGFMLVALGEAEAQLAYVDFPEGRGNAGWLPPIVADPLDPNSVYWCGERIWRYTFLDAAGTWVPVVHSQQDFGVDDGEYIGALAFSPVDPQRAYLSTNRGRLFHSEDGGVTWTASDDVAPGAHYFYGHGMVASVDDVDTAYVGGSGYGNPPVLRTTDGGRTWQDWSLGLPETLVYDLAEATDGSGRIFAATETSAWTRRRSDGGWTELTRNDAPVTTYWSVEWLPHEPTARFGTYGRGIWDYQLDPEGTGCVVDQDHDRDGVACDLDCDDEDPTRHPGADDPCDGIDSDCDGTVEIDQDGDGFLVCDECNDGDATLSPDARQDGCDKAGGCGCAAEPTAPAGLMVLLPLVVGLLRRRRGLHDGTA